MQKLFKLFIMLKKKLEYAKNKQRNVQNRVFTI